MRITKRCHKSGNGHLCYDNEFFGLQYTERMDYNRFFNDIIESIEYKIISDLVFNYDTLIITTYEIRKNEWIDKDIYMVLDEELIHDSEFRKRLDYVLKCFNLNKRLINKHIKEIKEICNLNKSVRDVTIKCLKDYANDGSISNLDDTIKYMVLNLVKSDKKNLKDELNDIRITQSNENIINSLTISLVLSKSLTFWSLLPFICTFDKMMLIMPILLAMTSVALSSLKNIAISIDKTALIERFQVEVEEKIMNKKKNEEILIKEPSLNKKGYINDDYFVLMINKYIVYLSKYPNASSSKTFNELCGQLTKLKMQYINAFLYSNETNCLIDKKFFMDNLLSLEKHIYASFPPKDKDDIPLNLDMLIERIEYLEFDVNTILGDENIKVKLFTLMNQLLRDNTDFTVESIELLKELIDLLSKIQKNSLTEDFDNLEAEEIKKLEM